MSAATLQLPTKQQLRTRETHARLLNSAEEVFVRDGYEAAQLDAIAARAGRSKGAVYTHFKSKEDLFLALFEHRTRCYIDRLVRSLDHCTLQKERMAAFRQFYIEMGEDKTWPILTLEFKLYALRHPNSIQRLRRAFERSKPRESEAGEARMFGHLTPRQKADKDLAVVALSPILSGLILERHFEPEVLTDKGLRRLLSRIFDALFPPRT